MSPEQLKEIEAIAEGVNNPQNWLYAKQTGRVNVIALIVWRIFPNGPTALSECTAHDICRSFMI